MAETVGALIIAGLAQAGVTVPSTLGALTGIPALEGVTTAGLFGSTALLGASIGLSFALSKPAAAKTTGANGQLSIRQPTAPRQGGYGRARVSGYYMLYEVEPPGIISTDVVALISGQIGGFKQFYLNDDAVTVVGGSVSAMPDGRYAGSFVALDWRVGLQHESVYANPFVTLPALWDAAHRGDGIASLNLIAQQSSDVNHQTEVYPNGLPNPSAVCDLFAVWDPRDPVQNPDDPLTWISYPPYDAATTYVAGATVILPAMASGVGAYNAGTTYAQWDRAAFGGVEYFSRVDGNVGHTPGAAALAFWLPIGAVYRSRAGGNLGQTPDLKPDKWIAVNQNPVLQTIDFLINADYGLGLDRAVLITPVLANLKAKADLCDELVADKFGSLGPRYTSNGRFNFDDDPADVLGAIAATCDMWWAEDGDGSLAMQVGVYSSPAVVFTNAHILGFSVNYGVPDEQAVNELTLTFCDPGSKYKDDIAGEAWRNEADISVRGKIRSQALPLPWVQRHSQARRLAKRAAARLAASTGTMTLTLYGLRALGQRWVGLQYPFLPGLEDCVVEVSRAAVDFMAGTVTVDWLLIDPDTIDAWNPQTEEGSGPSEVATDAMVLSDDDGQPLTDDDGDVLIDETA